MSLDFFQSNLFTNYLIPHDSTWVKKALQEAAILSDNDSILESHFISTIKASEAILFSCFNIFSYPVRGSYNFCKEVVHLNFCNAFIYLRRDTCMTFQSLLLTSIGVFLLSAGILFPQFVYKTFQPLVDVHAQLRTENNRLRAAQEAANQRESELMRRVNVLSEQQRALQIENEQQRERSNQSSQRCNLLMQQIQGLNAMQLQNTQQIENEQQRNAQIQEQLQQAMANNEQLREENQRFQVVVNGAEERRQENQILKGQNNQLLQNLEQERQRSAQIQEQLQQEQAHNHALKKENESLQPYLGPAFEDLLIFNQRMENDYSQNEDVSEQLEALKKGNQELKEENEKLKNKCEDLLSRLLSRGNDSIPIFESPLKLSPNNNSFNTLDNQYDSFQSDTNLSTSSLNLSRSSLIDFLPSTPSEKNSVNDSFSSVENNSLNNSFAFVENSHEKQQIQPNTNRFLNAFASWVHDGNHPSKLHKYRVVLNAYMDALKNDFAIDLNDVYQKSLTLASKGDVFNNFAYLIQVLVCPIDPYSKYVDARTQYHEFVETLRTVITNDTYKRIKNSKKEHLSEEELFVREHVRSICRVRWAHTEIFSYLKEITDLTINIHENGQKTPLTSENLTECIEKEIEAIKNAPQDLKKPQLANLYQKALGSLGQKDFTGTENTPNVIGHMLYEKEKGGDFEVIYCRHGTPHLPGHYSTALAGTVMRAVDRLLSTDLAPRNGEGVAPDYLEFIEAAKESAEPIFYCVHQRLTPNVIENERDRVEALINLEKEHKNFFTLVQAVEGPLFNRENGFNMMTSVENLKEALSKAFDDPKNSGCRLPACFDNDDYKKGVLPKLLDDVHHLFFEHKIKIETLEEWQSFIQAFYIFQKIDLKFRIRDQMEVLFGKAPKKMYYTTSCKDFLDRGGNQAFAEGRIHDYWIGRENDPELLEDRRVNLEGPPIAVKKQEPIEYRIRPGLLFDKRLFKLPNKEKLHEYTFNGWKIKQFYVNKPQNQTAIPNLHSAKTPIEVITYLNSLQQSGSMLPEDYSEVFGNIDSYKGDKEKIFHQVNRDLNGRQQTLFEVDKNEYKETAEQLLNYLISKGKSDGNALEILTLFQQGIGAQMVEKLMQMFNCLEHGLMIQQKDSETDKEMLRTYSLTTDEDGAKIEFSTKFVLRAGDLEKKSFANVGNFAEIVGHATIIYSNDPQKQKATWYWEISNVKSL